MLDYKPNIVLSNQDFNVIGTRPIRHDGWDKVTGRARYAADANFAGMLYGKFLRSPHAHARIKSIDYSEALKLPGVRAVVTSEDLPDVSARLVDQEEGSAFNYGFFTRNTLAREKALFKGHPIVAVAAVTQHIAEEAVGLIKVAYDVLPPVLNAVDAMKPDAPLIHENLIPRSSAAPGPIGWGDDPTENGSNVANHFVHQLGDIDKGFQESDIIVEREFDTKRVHQGYIEPHSTTVSWGKDGYVTVWTSTQQLFGVRDHMSAILDVPTSRIKVVPMEIGGGFGGKGVGGVYLEPVAAILSRKAGKPVKLSMTRTEVFVATGPTSSANLRVKMGATKDGKLNSVEAHLIYEAGAFPGSPVAGGARCMF